MFFVFFFSWFVLMSSSVQRDKLFSRFRWSRQPLAPCVVLCGVTRWSGSTWWVVVFISNPHGDGACPLLFREACQHGALVEQDDRWVATTHVSRESGSFSLVLELALRETLISRF